MIAAIAQPAKPLLELVRVEAVQASRSGNGNGPGRGASRPEGMATFEAIRLRARKAMMGGGASGRWGSGGLVYLGSRGELLLHKGGFGDGEKRRVRLCEMKCTVNDL